MTGILDRLRAGLADRYRLERELGRGGMATVYLAEDLKHHRTVALKALRPELAAALGPERFLREIEVAAQLRHPHILPLFDSGEVPLDGGSSSRTGEPRLLYYVMPYVEGDSLRGRLTREKQLPLEDAIRLALEVADALAAAHHRGIVHRDIKPENILLEGGHAVIADFGIARALSAAGASRLTETGMALGTPQYMSPEQAAGGEADARTDIYALGCVLYEMLTGAPPFTGATAQAVLARHSVDVVPSMRAVRSTIPAPVEQVVLRALEKVPADRHASARHFADALTLAASGVAFTAEVASAAPHRTRRGTLAIFGGLAALAAAMLWRADSSAFDGDPVPRVAVLTLDNLSPDTSDRYLARGLTEEIASRLADFPEVTVAGQNSVDRLERAHSGELLDRARALGFGYLVEGSLRRARDRVRVAVRLVEAADGVRRWERSYDRAATDLLALQDEIALDVARAVAGQLTTVTAPERPALIRDPAAHDQLLRGNYYLAQRTPRGLARAVEAYAEAARLDSGSALPFARLAHAHVLFLDWGWTYDELPPESLLARGWQAAERAVRLDPALADAWAAKGSLLRFREPRTLAGVRETFRRALELDPSDAGTHHEFAMNLRLLGEVDSAAAEFQRALAAEPDRPMSLVHLAWIDMVRRRYGDARRWLDSATAVNPGFFQAYTERAQLRLKLGDTAGAQVDAETAVRLRPADEPLAGEDALMALEMRRGDTAAARARLARLRSIAPKPDGAGVHQATGWAAVLTAAGEHREAVVFLEQSASQPAHLGMHLEEPRFDALRSDERFGALLERLRAREP